jgi:hypothetical protein
MKDTILGVVAILFLTLLLPVILLRIRDWFRGRRRGSDERIPAHMVAYRESLLRTDPVAVEEELGGLLSKRLTLMYEDHQAILSRNIELRPPHLGPKQRGRRIERFLPLDPESQEGTCDLQEAGWGQGFCFAVDGAGNFYWQPVTKERHLDAPVFFACHDPWGNEKVADSLEDFLSWPRVPLKR